MSERDEWAYQLALVIAKARHGEGVDMGGAHNPRPSETLAALRFMEDLERNGWRRVSADPDTVERVAEALRVEIGPAAPELPDEWADLARAAINAIGGGQDAA